MAGLEASSWNFHTDINQYTEKGNPIERWCLGFPGGSDGKESNCSVGALGSIPGLGRSGEGNGYPLQYSCLENPMGWGACWATVHGVTKSRTRLSAFTHSAFLIVRLSHPHMTTIKTIVLTICTFVIKVMSLLFNVLSRFVITFIPRSKQLLISWLESLSTVILKLKKVKSVTAI